MDLSISALRLWIQELRITEVSKEGCKVDMLFDLQNDASVSAPFNKVAHISLKLQVVHRPWKIAGLDEPAQCATEHPVLNVVQPASHQNEFRLRDSAVAQHGKYQIQFILKWTDGCVEMEDWGLRLVCATPPVDDIILLGVETEPGLFRGNPELSPLGTINLDYCARQLTDLLGSLDVSTIWENPDRLREGFTGCQVWDSSIVLANQLKSMDIKGKSVLDMGSGTGIAGICAGTMGAKVMLTDLGSMLPLANRNAQMYQSTSNSLGGSINVDQLEWGNSEDETDLLEELNGVKFQIILGSDIAYSESSCVKFLSTLHKMTETGSILVLAYRQRSSVEQHFFHRLSEWFESCGVARDPEMKTMFPNVYVSVFVKRASRESISCAYCVSQINAQVESSINQCQDSLETLHSSNDANQDEDNNVNMKTIVLSKVHTEDVIALDWQWKLISGSCDTRMGIWKKINSGAAQTTLIPSDDVAENGHTDSIACVGAISEQVVLTAGFDGRFVLWNVDSGNQLDSIHLDQVGDGYGGVESMAMKPLEANALSTTVLAITETSAVVALQVTLNLPTARMNLLGVVTNVHSTQQGEPGSPYCSWIKEHYFVTGGSNGAIVLWHAQARLEREQNSDQLTQLQCTQVLPCGVTSLVVHPSKYLVAVTGDTGVSAVVDVSCLETSEKPKVSVLHGHVSSVEHACWCTYNMDSDSLPLLATCSTDTKLLLWEVNEQDPQQSLTWRMMGTCSHPCAVTCVASPATHSWVVSADIESTVRVWDTKSYTLLANVTLDSHILPIVTMTLRMGTIETEEANIIYVAIGREDGAVGVVQINK